MKRSSFFALILLIACAPQAHAEADAMPLEFHGPTGRIANSFSAFTQRVQGYNSYQNRFDLELEEDASKAVSDTTSYGARVAPWLWWRAPEAVGGAPHTSRAQLELKEGWVERTSGSWDVRLGNQIVAWGAADQINPTDVWNARDLYDPLSATKLPLFMARVKVHPPENETFALDAIFAPFFRESRLPAELPGSATEIRVTDSRWLMPLPTVLNAGNGGLIAPLSYVVTPATYPVSWQAGARLALQRLGGWDFSLSYYNGVETTPRLAFTKQGSATDAALPVAITLYPSFHRQQMFGVDGAGSVSIAKHDVGTRFEVAYFKRDNSRADTAPPEFQSDLIKDDYVHGVFGADYTVPTSILGTVVYGNLQYVLYQRIGDKEQQAGATVIRGLPDVNPWDSDAVLYLEDRIGSTFKLTANTIYSFAHGDVYTRPGFEYDLTDNLKAAASADFFLGSRSGFFGQFHDNRRVNAVVSYVF